jgi:hypothetical protein
VREAAIGQGGTDMRSAGPRGRVGPVEKKKMGRGWVERPDGPAGRWADGAEAEEKFFCK